MEAADNNIYEPLKLFDTRYREEHQKNVSDYFEALVKKAKIDEQANVLTVKEIRKKEAEINDADKKRRKTKGLKGFLIFLIVVLFVVAAVFVYGAVTGTMALALYLQILIALAAVGLAVYLIVVIQNKLNKTIKELGKVLAILNDKKNGFVNEAWKQLAPLNALYDWGMTAALVHQTIPLITMDKFFDIRRYDYLHRKYGLEDNSNVDSSVVCVQSGEIVGNPFLLTRKLNFAMGTKTYSGTLTIHWTTTITINGKTEVQHHTQTLVAYLTRPFPTYGHSDVLIYGNEAAPDLTFSRSPSNANNLNEKQVEKLADRESKKIEKMSQKSISKGGDFNAMSNTDFEGLFKALNRDNEVQFRLLFTPLAQQQMLDLIKDKRIGYGDDFSFIKQRCINRIFPQHLNGQDVYANPNKYVQYELAASRKIFNDYNNQYFKMFYFALAPILSIPLYQQYKPREFIYQTSYESYVSCWEHEAISNGFDLSAFKHPRCVTNNILKTHVVSSIDGADEISVTAHGFEGIPRLDYVPVVGGDGRTHNVPVPWTQYLPVQQTSNVVVKVAEQTTRNDFLNHNNEPEWKAFFTKAAGSPGAANFARSLLAFRLNNPLDTNDLQRLGRLLNTNDKRSE
jgi:hypothetical protein